MNTSLLSCLLLLLVLSCCSVSTFVAAQTTATTTTTTTAGTTSTTTAANSTNTTTTQSPAATTTSAPVTTNPSSDNRIRNVSCPFSRWQGDPRYCYECRWCPFRKQTCCEMEDEIAVLKSVNVSGSTDWDCFITIVHFQQCGRCDPRSYRYIMNKTLNYVWDPRGVSIRPCKQACKYIYKQCKDAKTLTGDDVVPSGQSESEFCAEYPEITSDEMPCFESAGQVSAFLSMAGCLIVTVFLLL